MCAGAMCVLAMGFPGPLVQAQSGGRAIVTILTASNTGKDINIANDAYRDQVVRLFSYSSYEQKGAAEIHLELGNRQRVDLPGGYELLLALQQEEKDRVMVQAVIRKERQNYVDTVLSILKPGVVVLGGPPVGSDTLIIVLEMVL